MEKKGNSLLGKCLCADDASKHIFKTDANVHEELRKFEITVNRHIRI